MSRKPPSDPDRFGHRAPKDKLPRVFTEEELRQVDDYKKHETDSMENAYYRANILKELNLKYWEYEQLPKDRRIHRRTAEKLISCIEHSRMSRDDWNKPDNYSTVVVMLQQKDKMFELMMADRSINPPKHEHNHVTRKQIQWFINTRKLHKEHQFKPATLRWKDAHVLIGGVLAELARLPPDKFHCVVTSPPYYLQRFYSRSINPAKWYEGKSMETNDLEIGFEPTPEEYIAKLVEVLRQVKRVLHPDGCVWLNIGDVFAGASGIGSQSGLVEMGRNIIERQGNTTSRGTAAHGRVHSDQYNLKPKDLILIPARLAIALQDDGWYVRSDVIWEKADPMPDPAKDRPKRAYEHILLLSKSDRYFYDGAAIATSSKNYSKPDRTHDKKNDGGSGHRPHQGLRVENFAETGANCRDVWTFAHAHTGSKTEGTHYATFPPELPRRCILAGTSKYGCCATCGKPFDQEGKPWNGRGCKHKGHVVPCRVLDLFAGTRTTGIVATILGRESWDIELNPEYVAGADAKFDEILAWFEKNER